MLLRMFAVWQKIIRIEKVMKMKFLSGGTILLNDFLLLFQLKDSSERERTDTGALYFCIFFVVVMVSSGFLKEAQD